ncbi:DNA replication initiation factor [Saccharomycopsis crataegensis]|uniref:DNA replication initiation factor n=1 Tax=Saccharomycopsis crataegensis TaxID=43959 RepID=A0AAV5QP14_9ASCO|nr:DNA replication initiation factor [Saccharomycopsis crataegensis]
MYLEPNEFSKSFKEIKATSLSHSTCKLVIYTSCLNIDALCGAKMLSMVFKKQLIPYQLIPVVGYSDLKSHYEKIDEDVTNVILIGCGAMVDLENFFEIDPEDYINSDPTSSRKLKRKIYVIDGHRPWNLDNIFGSEIVTCYDDGHINEDLSKEREAYQQLLEIQQREDSDEEETNSDEEKENDSDDERYHGDDDDNDDDEEKEKPGKKRKNDEILNSCEESLEEYYSQGATVITSVTAQVYSMVSSLSDNEADIDTLWLSIIGTTSLDYGHPQVYKKLYPLLKDEVTRMSPQFLGGNTSQRKQSNDASYIAIDKDYYLFLLRHWSLYNSFLYSNYVNSKLYLWQEEGRKKLNKMFAKMGISLQAANQNWLYMDIEIKKKLNSIFKKYLGLYDLEDLIREGFVRQFGYKGSISASEYVESLAALLQHDLEDTQNENNVNKADDEEHGSDDEDVLLKENDQTEITRKLVEKEKKWVNNFWASWDALSTEKVTLKKDSSKKIDGIDLIKNGLDVAKCYQKIIFKTGVMIMEKKLLKSLRVFRLVVLKDDSIPYLNFYRNPLNLTRLGQWVLESLAELDNQPLLPLVLASLDSETDTYLVVGLAPLFPRNSEDENNNENGKRRNKRTKRSKNGKRGNAKSGSNKEKEEEEEEEEEELFGINKVLLNTFSVAFQQVASSTGAKVRIDSFESSVIEIRKDDLSPFLEKLTLCGLV